MLDFMNMDLHNPSKPTPEQIEARRSVIGMWKGRAGEMIKEVERGRKEWDKKVDKLHREWDRLRRNKKQNN